MSQEIVVIGSSNTDMIVKVSRLPQAGETVLGGQFSTASGGKGANQAVAAVRAGGKVIFITRLGTDAFGNQLLEGLQHDGIDTDYIIRDADTHTGIASIMVDDNGENMIAVTSGANGRFSPADIHTLESVVSKAGIILMQLEIPLETVQAAVRIAARHHIPVILNPAPAQSLPQALLSNVTYLTPNEIETEQLTGIAIHDRHDCSRACDILRNKGIANVIITMGGHGSYLAANGGEELIPAFKVQAIDTTAAGDVFNGVLAAGLLENQDIREAVYRASAAAALSVTKLGAQPSAPHRKEIDKFMHKHAYHI